MRNITSTTVLTPDHLDSVVAYFMSKDAFAFDVETTGEYRGVPIKNEAVWMGLATHGMAVSIPFGHPNGNVLIRKAGRKKNKITGKFDTFPAEYDAPPEQMRPSQVFGALKPLFFSDKVKVAHNATFDLISVAKYFGDVPPPPYADTIVIQWLLNENLKSKGLKELVKKYYKLDYDTENVGKRVEDHPFWKVARYQYLDAKYTWLLYKRLEKKIHEEGLDQIYRLEMDVLGVLLDMGLNGAAVDHQTLFTLEDDLSRRLTELEADIYRSAGSIFNLNAPAQKAKILYSPKAEGGQGLKATTLTDGGKKKQEAGQPLTWADYSTSADVLESLKSNPVVAGIVEYQEVAKLLGTYVQGYLGDPEDPKKPSRIFDGKVHADLVQYGTVTGRFSCVAADSLIETPRDMSKYPDGIPISQIKKGDWVYAFDHERQLVLRKVKWVAQTGVKQTLVVTLENSEGHRRTLRLTPEHLVMLRNGDWRPAAHLLKAPGELTRSLSRSVMTMVRRRVEDGYIRFFPNAQAKGNGSLGGGQNREHRWIMSQLLGRELSTKYDVDHIDGNKLNNHPSNLRYVPSLEHRGNREMAWGVEQPPAPDIYSGKLDYRTVSIEPGPVEPVWDMEVEDVHNFIANGVCVHNCREPNLQNIPRPDTELGKKIRGLFVAPPGHKLIVADYGQIELVVLAHFIRRGRLFDGFHQGIDPHSSTAAALVNSDPHEFMELVKSGDPEAKKLRQTAKGINFAVVYGAGPDKVANMAGISLKEAKRFLQIHERQFPEIYAFKDQVLRVCKDRRPPYITTLLGRKRRLPEIWSNNYGVRGKAERQAVNSLIQGSAADIIKLAMVRLHATLEEGMYLSLSVHDELVTVARDDVVDRATEIVREAMLGEGIQRLLRVPLSSDVVVVDRWSDAK